MTSIGDLFNHFMNLIGLNYYNKTESDEKYALKTDIPANSTIDSSLSSSSENAVQNKVIKSALDGKVSTSQGSSNKNKNVVTDNSGNITVEAKPSIPSKTSDLENDSGFLTSHQSLSNYVTTDDSRLSDARTPTSHSHGSLTNSGTLNSDISSVNKVAVTDSSNNLKTISQLPYSKISGTPTIPSKTSDLSNDGDGTNAFVKTNDSRLSDSRTPTSHTHGSVTNDGKIGSVSGKIITTGTGGALQASDSITKSMISDFPSSMTPTSHEHSASDVKDNSAYSNIGSSANATQKTINDKINTAIGLKANSNNVYSKSETYTQSEITTAISNAVSDLQLFEVVSSLPTSNIKTNRLYLIVNGETIANNKYDIYLRVNNDWEALDSLEFDISNFYNKSEIDTLLNGKVDTSDSRLTNARTPTSHSHGDISNTGTLGSTANKPLITGTNGKIGTGSFGTGANTFCEGNDSRLSDARTPTAHSHTKSEITDFPTSMAPTSHTHTKSEITDFPTTMTPSSHTHGNLQNDGTVKVSGTVQKSKNLVTDSSGNLSVEDKYSHPSSHPASMITGLSSVATSGSYSDLSNKPSYTATVQSTDTDAYKIGSINISGSTVDIYGKDSDTVYTHPNDLNTTKTSGLYKVALNTKGHVTSATSVEKSDITALGIPSSDTTYNLADGTNSGLSSNDFTSSYKSALDNLSTTIANALSGLELVEILGANDSLPTTNIKKKLYLKPNGNATGENKYDIYVYVNSSWEKIDSLDFNISDYIKKVENNTNLVLANGNNIAQSTFATGSDVDTKVSTHNSSNSAHSDIRNSIPTDVSDLTDNEGVIPTDTTDLTNGAGFLTSHQSLSNYVTTDDSRLSDTRTPTSHTHGNISNVGAITTVIDAIDTTDDKLIVSDSSDSSKLKSVSFVDALNDVVLDLINEAS